MKKIFAVLSLSLALAACSSTEGRIHELDLKENQTYSLEDLDSAKRPLEDIIVFDYDGVTIRREGNNLVLSMPEMVLFDFDRYAVKEKIKPSLRILAKALGEHRDIKIKIDGYTDFIGSDSYNLALSVKRAKAIKTYLTEFGAIPNNISIEGYGKQNPIASNQSISGRARNRRVEFIISRN